MKFFKGFSNQNDCVAAVGEATSWHDPSESYDMVFVFYSGQIDGSDVTRELHRKFPNTPIAGCSTAGEHLAGKHYNEYLIVTAIQSPGTRWSVGLLKDLDKVTVEATRQCFDETLKSIDLDRNDLNPKRNFVVNFVDGLSSMEEELVACMVESFEGIPFLGGSAGDNLQFKQTHVLCDQGAYSNAAVFVVVDTDFDFSIVKHQHFETEPTDLVVTSATESERKVHSIDGMPARVRYAHLVGCKVEELGPEIFSQFPLIFSADGEYYVRSILSANDDDSLSFYCAIEEGMVLEVASHRNMQPELEKDLTEAKKSFEKIDLFLVCNCILRSLESIAKNNHDDLGKLMTNLTDNVVGFDTYGEQLNGLHINQTLVGLILGKKAA
ncbi:MAG: FIST C-terminal domain-containing protein [Pseudobacteriovorax sp.]|nr:FIST C-terminal domain-containing protein [Pseudobacteriovorax sp.]